MMGIRATQLLGGELPVYAGQEEILGGMGVGGLVTIIVVAVVLIVTLVWIFRNLRKRD